MIFFIFLLYLYGVIEMLTLKQYEELQKQTIKSMNEINNKKIKEIITEIESINDLNYLCEKKIMPYGTIQYKTRTIKTKYHDEINQVIKLYHRIIFPDLSFNTDVNSMINGPYSLKIWLTRYLCYALCHEDLTQYLNDDFYSMSITEQFQLIDLILFNLVLTKKVS